MSQQQQLTLHPNSQKKSVTMYGSCVDGIQEECGTSEEYNQELSSSKIETKKPIHETYRNNRPFHGLFLFGVSLLVMAVVVATTFHPSIIASSSLSSTAASTSLSMLAMESTTSTSTTTTTNQLIDILQSSSTIIHPQSYYKSKVDEFPSLSIDLERERQVYNGRTTKEQISMTIEWTNGLFHSSSTEILNSNSNDKSIIALLCGDSDSHLYYMDAKTITDAASHPKKTRQRFLLRHRTLTETEWYYGAKDYFDWWGGSGTIREKTWHTNSNNNNDDTTYEYSHDGNDSVWYIASVPQSILDHRKCQAIIYYYIRDEEYVVMSKSTIIHV
jgi:hypothetical protein